jgi:hypothetical protein
VRRLRIEREPKSFRKKINKLMMVKDNLRGKEVKYDDVLGDAATEII